MPSKLRLELFDVLSDLSNLADSEYAAYRVPDELYDMLCRVESVIERTAVTSLLSTILHEAQPNGYNNDEDTEVMTKLRKFVREAIEDLLPKMLKAYDANTITRTAMHLLEGLHETKASLKQKQDKNELSYVNRTMQRLNQCIKVTTIQHV